MQVIIAYAQAFYLIATAEFPNEDIGEMECSFCSLSKAMLTLWRLTAGDIQYATTFSIRVVGRTGTLLLVTFALLSNILLLNLLIAVLTDTFKLLRNNHNALWKLQWARFILLFERRLPKAWRQNFRLGEPEDGAEDEDAESSLPSREGSVNGSGRPGDGPGGDFRNNQKSKPHFYM